MSTTTPDSVVHVRDLEIAFPTRQHVLHAVNGVSFDVARGEVLGIVGESGCGKSTIGRALMGLVPEPGRITAGSVRVAGTEIVGTKPSSLRALRGNRVAMVFQDPMSSLNPVMTIGAQIREALAIHTPLRGAAANRRAVELLEMVGIPDPQARLDSYPHQMSGGMRQRAGIAMAISCEPDILVADEPTTALDVTVQAQVIDLLRRLRSELGMSIVIISHDLGVVADIADRVLVLYGGYVVEEGPTREVLARTVHPYTEGLVGSRTEIDGPRPERLRAIPGAAPILAGPAAECTFRPRCPLVEFRCREDNPELVPVGNAHRAACHVRTDSRVSEDVA